MRQFEFATATRIIFGNDCAADAGMLAAEFGRRALVITGRNPDRAAMLLDNLQAAGVQVATFAVTGEPTIEMARQGVAQAKTHDAEIIISFGGGSVIDAGKAIAALVTNPGDPLDYLEVIGAGKPLTQPPLPFIAIPTTAGTGAEVTKNAVLKSEEHRVKISLRHPAMLPDVALVDPMLTVSMPPSLTASTGMDALTQVLEPYVSRFASPITDAFCQDGLRRAAGSLRRVFTDGHDESAREEMALVSLLGGLALANAKLGAVHGFAGPLGGMYPAPHGAICAALLPHVVSHNVRLIKEHEPDNPVLTKFDDLGRFLTGRDSATAADAVTWIEETATLLQIAGLATYGVKESDFEQIIEKSARSSSMKGNPITLTADDMRAILQAAL